MLTRHFLALEFCLQDDLEKFDFRIGEVRVPKVHNQIDASLFALIPRLVIERVVKDDALTLLEITLFVTDSHRGAFRAEDGQVEPQFLACRTVVCGDVSARSDSGEETVGVISRNNILQDLHRFRDFGAVVRKWDIVQVKVEDIPVAGTGADAPNSVLRNFRLVFVICVGRAAVRLEAICIPQRGQLFSDHVKLGL